MSRQNLQQQCTKSAEYINIDIGALFPMQAGILSLQVQMQTRAGINRAMWAL